MLTQPTARRLHSTGGLRTGRCWQIPLFHASLLDELSNTSACLNDNARTYLSLGADIRERFEVNDTNFGTGGNRQNEYVLSRVETHADLRVAGQVQVFFQLQSDTAPGKDRLSPVDQDRLGIEQGFVAVSEPFGGWGSHSAGGGAWSVGFDLQRFLSARDGPNGGAEVVDGVSVAYTLGPWRVNGLYTHPVENRDSSSFDDYSGPRLSFDLLRLARELTSSSSLSAYVAEFRRGRRAIWSASGMNGGHSRKCALLESVAALIGTPRPYPKPDG